MQKDALLYVRKCEKCQKFSPLIHQPAAKLNSITGPWPFAQWGLDLVGPMPTAPGNNRYMITATDYFTKWIEAAPLAKIRDTDVIKFLWSHIITRFGVPRSFIADNGTQFDSQKLRSFCEEFGIKNNFSSVAYPQGNGQAEASNKVIVEGIKKRLDRAKGRWVEELPSVLWAYRTTPRRSTGETPFSMSYGVEAVIPLEVGLPGLRTTAPDLEQNEDTLAKDLDLLDEKRDRAMIRLASYQQELARAYNKRVYPREFKVGDLVLRKVTGNTKEPTDGKLGPNWEGPYKIRSVAGVGAYLLDNMEGEAVARPWNANNLKIFYF